MNIGLLAKGGNTGLRMPRDKADETGAEYTGEVLSGRQSVEQRRAAEVVELLHRRGDVARYGSVEDYDPVLRWHCRLDRM